MPGRSLSLEAVEMEDALEDANHPDQEDANEKDDGTQKTGKEENPKKMTEAIQILLS